MSSRTTTRWTLGGLVLVGLVLTLQVLFSHALSLYGLRLTVESWLLGSLHAQVPMVIESSLSGPRSVVETEIMSNPEDAALSTALMGMSHEDVDWWIVRGTRVAAASTTSPACRDAVLESLPVASDRPGVLVCNGSAWVFDTVRGSERTVVFAVPLDLRIARAFKRITRAETLIRADGVPLHTSMLAQSRDRRVPGSEAFDPKEIRGLPAPGSKFSVPTLTAEGYAGFVSQETGEVTEIGSPSETWYVYSEFLSGSPRVDILLMVPRPVMTMGQSYALVLLAGGSLLAVALTGLLIFRSVSRFRAPLDRLLASASQVAVGDFSEKVPVPENHEMAEFVTTYNAVLDRLEELIRARATAAREAGMAEIASGVLHNVGNALTSVTAGIALAEERLEKLPLGPLGKLARMLAEHKDRLPELFAEGGKGALIPTFVSELSATLEGEHARLAVEIGTIKKASSHATEVLRAQQRNARRVDVAEPCSMMEVIEDALRLCGFPRGRHGIELVRDFGGDVQTCVDVHRLIGILVNLLNNAAEALADVTGRSRRIVVSLQRKRSSFEIRVADNGPGIAAQDVTKIFSYGYSTKAHGHGFGLHASFNAANEIGGWLRLDTHNAEGATFCLVLPIRSAPLAHRDFSTMDAAQ